MKESPKRIQKKPLIWIQGFADLQKTPCFSVSYQCTRLLIIAQFGEGQIYVERGCLLVGLEPPSKQVEHLKKTY